jgi:hypothetical protein
MCWTCFKRHATRVPTALKTIDNEMKCLVSVSHQLYKTESRHAQIRALAIQHLIKRYEGSDKELVVS